MAGDVKKKVQLSAREISSFEVKDDAGRISWNEDKAKELKIVFSQLECDTISKAFKTLEDAKALSPEHVKLYRHFVVDAKPVIEEDRTNAT